MTLVDYSSDDSENEINHPVANQIAETSTSIAKPSFQKVVDTANPHRIRVHLPSDVNKVLSSSRDDTSEPEPKRLKLGSGGRGINAFLPAPKHPATAATGVQSSRGRGLGSGISLRTGAEPGFTREPMPETASNQEVDSGTTPKHSMHELSEVTASVDDDKTMDFTKTAVEADGKPKRQATMFRPLSIARKPQKKKHASSTIPGVAQASTMAIAGGMQTTSNKISQEMENTKAKISLFSIDSTDETKTSTATGLVSGQYQPLLYGSTDAGSDTESTPQQADLVYSDAATPAASQSLDTIANDLNLSAAERRQLFGRGSKTTNLGSCTSAINVANFNMDAEYAANEELRAAGELPEQQHKMVRTVNASGKNSLRQLVNVVSSQGDALEERFARGRRNKAEAGSRYGW